MELPVMVTLQWMTWTLHKVKPRESFVQQLQQSFMTDCYCIVLWLHASHLYSDRGNSPSLSLSLFEVDHNNKWATQADQSTWTVTSGGFVVLWGYMSLPAEPWLMLNVSSGLTFELMVLALLSKGHILHFNQSLLPALTVCVLGTERNKPPRITVQ